MPNDLLDYPDRYPEAPGYAKRDTSQRAAQYIAPETPRLRRMCLEALQAAKDGLTADECAEALEESVLSIRPRFTELARQQQIVDTGNRRKNASGRSAIVWRASSQGSILP